MTEKINPNPCKLLRDKFAMAALTGILSSSRINEIDFNQRQLAADAAASGSYILADAMLKAREVKP